MQQMQVNTRYTRSDDYEFQAYLERLNLDDERRHDVLSGHGFIIDSPKTIKDDVKNPNGIYSTKYGPGLQDLNACKNRYRCKCGATTQRFYHGLKCPVCGEPVEYKGDDFELFGYICLKDPYHVIHPNLFMSIAFLIGEKDFMNIITHVDKKNEDGHSVEIKRPKDEPFYGIGMMDFHDRFDEIIDWYVAKRPVKKEYYDDIVANRDKVFTQSVPVFTIHLRPYRLDGGVFHYEGTNAMYNMIAKLSDAINKDNTKMNKKTKPKNQLLLDMQMEIKKLYDEITKIISGKKGSKHVWIPVAKSTENNLLNCWKAKAKAMPISS